MSLKFELPPGLKLSVAAANSEKSKFRHVGFWTPQSIGSSALRILVSFFFLEFFFLRLPWPPISEDFSLNISIRTFLHCRLRQAPPERANSVSRTSFSSEQEQQLLLWSVSELTIGISNNTLLGEDCSSASFVEASCCVSVSWIACASRKDLAVDFFRIAIRKTFAQFWKGKIFLHTFLWSCRHSCDWFQLPTKFQNNPIENRGQKMKCGENRKGGKIRDGYSRNTQWILPEGKTRLDMED